MPTSPGTLVIYCDESVESGKHYSNFYGGALVCERNIQDINVRLNRIKADLNLNGEVKWTKVTDNYLDKYMDFLDAYMREVTNGNIKIRIMFTHNVHRPRGLNSRHIEDKYFLLYYQFIKHAFGLRHTELGEGSSLVRLMLDEVPETHEKLVKFRDWIASLSLEPKMRTNGLRFEQQHIASVRSHDHVILQGLDIILGAIQFRMNDKHLEIPHGSKRRGKRTIAKEKLYKHLLTHIRSMHRGFNPGITTGHGELGWAALWLMPYRHWIFVPRDYDYDESYEK